MFMSPPKPPEAPPPPVFADASQTKPQRKGAPAPTIAGAAPTAGQLGTKTLVGQ